MFTNTPVTHTHTHTHLSTSLVKSPYGRDHNQAILSHPGTHTRHWTYFCSKTTCTTKVIVFTREGNAKILRLTLILEEKMKVKSEWERDRETGTQR